MTKPTGKPRGRPILPASEKRLDRVNVYLSPDELARIDDQRGIVPRAKYIREVVTAKQTAD